ncbi:uncharacterized protein [Antedon mediterranea]|uniref:uncharacterized protein n=1 Tax=Antedon mediterranea TaxID=105859 RepID=UPI003AF79066
MAENPMNNDVNATFNLGGNMYQLTTCTFNKIPSEEWIEGCGVDIFFCREVNLAQLNNFNLYEPRFGTRFQGHTTAVLVKKNKFRQIEVLPFEDDLAWMNWRFCPIKLDGMIVAAWDGRSRLQGGHMPKEKKEQCLDQLRRYAMSLTEKHNLPVIIGGAFRVAQINYDDLPDNYICKRIEGGVNNDYFYVIFPKVRIGSMVNDNRRMFELVEAPAQG